MSDIRVYHSFRSPYSRLGLHLIERAGFDVELIPFTGPPEGTEFLDPVASKPKRAYYLMDAPRMTARMGLPIMPPNPFDVEMGPSYMAAIAASKAGFGLSYALAVSDARWGEGKDVSDLDVLKACAEKVGWDPEAVAKSQGAMSVAKEMKKHRALIEEDAVFGVPFAVRNGVKYWGHERFHILEEDVKGAR